MSCDSAAHTCRRSGELVGVVGNSDIYYCAWCDVEFIVPCASGKGGDCCE